MIFSFRNKQLYSCSNQLIQQLYWPYNSTQYNKQVGMSLKKYLPCNEEHYNQFQYVCLKEKRVFCLKCWFKKEHYRYCQSTRCGQYLKIAHLVLNRALQYKNSKLIQSFCGSVQSYQDFRENVLRINFQITESLKDFVEQKMPLLFLSMTNQLLKSKAPTEELRNYYKFDSISTQMIRIIKSSGSEKDSRQEYLQKSIGAYYDINHQIEGDLNVLRNNKFIRKDHKEDQLNQSIKKIKDNLNPMVNNVKKNIRKVIDDELEAMTTKIDPSAKYKGIVFQKITENDSFRKRQEYPYISLLAQEYSKLTDQQNQLYNGFHLSIPQLQGNAQQLLQVSKCFIKDKLFTIYQAINTVKSAFPYKFAYPIATTLTQDEEYEDLIIDLEKASLENLDANNSFLCTLNLVIMGRQLILIKLFNHPKFCYSMMIYNYKAQRAKFYDKLIEKIGLKNIPVRSNASVNKIQFSQELTDIELAYCHFQIAYQTIFLCHSDQLVFEGEKVMANRGAELFPKVIEKWRSTVQIDMNFNKPMTEMIRFFV